MREMMPRKTRRLVFMNHLLKIFVRAREEAGQSMTEYALIMAAIAVVAYVAYTALGTQVSTLVANVGAKL